MVKQVPYFEDSSGKAHKTPYDAWRAELTLWLVATKTINDAQAKQLVDHITSSDARERLASLGKIVDELHAVAPEPPARVYEDEA